MMIAFLGLSFIHLLLAFLVTVFAGFTKGITGFALPMIMISGMAMFIDPKLAIAAMVLPTFASNIWQALQNGWRLAIEGLKIHWLLISVTLAMIFIHAQWVGRLNLNALIAVLGASIALISLVQLIGVQFHIKPKHKNIGAFFTGQIAGFFGAISGTWGPPTVIYLLAINTPKAEQIRVQGISFGLGALMFLFAHQSTGLITTQSLWLSLFLLIPMAIGLYLGQIAQSRIDQKQFRKIVLAVLLIAGLNLLRRAVLG